MKPTDKVMTFPQAKKIAELCKEKGIDFPVSQYYYDHKGRLFQIEPKSIPFVFEYRHVVKRAPVLVRLAVVKIYYIFRPAYPVIYVVVLHNDLFYRRHFSPFPVPVIRFCRRPLSAPARTRSPASSPWGA